MKKGYINMEIKNIDNMGKWINYKEQLPELGIEVVAYNRNWIDEDFNPDGTRVGFRDEEGFFSARWSDYLGEYLTENPYESDCNKEIIERDINPEFWIKIPKFNKK